MNPLLRCRRLARCLPFPYFPFRPDLPCCAGVACAAPIILISSPNTRLPRIGKFVFVRCRRMENAAFPSFQPVAGRSCSPAVVSTVQDAASPTSSTQRRCAPPPPPPIPSAQELDAKSKYLPQAGAKSICCAFSLPVRRWSSEIISHRDTSFQAARDRPFSLRHSRR